CRRSRISLFSVHSYDSQVPACLWRVMLSPVIEMRNSFHCSPCPLSSLELSRALGSERGDSLTGILCAHHDGQAPQFLLDLAFQGLSPPGVHEAFTDSERPRRPGCKLGSPHMRLGR